MSIQTTAHTTSAASPHRATPWWLKRVLFTALLWTVEAAVLLGLEQVLGGFVIKDLGSGVAMVVLMSILNALIWPLALWLTFPIAFFTLGVFTLLLNALVAYLAGAILS